MILKHLIAANSYWKKYICRAVKILKIFELDYQKTDLKKNLRDFQ